ncbi:DUF4865 family protein [Bacillus sp. M6-12]|uniref:DUF4865 family protein n=1 Tax=Bacillus sp. M6-12 TaxID=2054166 RepID=UPI0015E13075
MKQHFDDYKFIFDNLQQDSCQPANSYDNILNSFGWQQVNVGIPIIDTIKTKIKETNYLFQITREIQP